MTDAPARLTAALADRYRVERELGQGGMATVYLAHDLKHDRQVALKVLRPELAAVIGAERFLAEIKTTAHLQHSHILPLFDSGGADSFLFYVMPYVEGESLRNRLSREKQLPIADAVRIATEVAGALDYAHRHGVIHRDIKPENILLHDGQALVADFGIALAVSQAGGTRLTETGLSLGTPHYMSPEQAMGERDITARSDVYALGCVAYEMLAGEPPFTGPTAQSIVAKVLTEDARPLIPRRHTVPPHVEDAVLTALEKLPADRWASAKEFAEALEGGSAAGRLGGGRRHKRDTALTSLRNPALRSAVLAALALAVGLFLGSRAKSPGSLPRFGQSLKVTWDPGLEVLPALSPDGRSVAYASGTSASMRIYVRPVAGGRSIPLTDDTTDVQSHPRWSRDGTRILFLARGAVFSAPAAGGPAKQEVPAGRDSPIIITDWSPDGRTIVYVVADSLFLRDQGGTPRKLATLVSPASCTWSPNGALLACSSGNALHLIVGPAFGNISPSRIVICRVADGAITTVSDSLSLNQSPIWAPDGRRLFFISNRHGPRDIYVQTISGDGRATGPAERLTTGLDAQTISMSADGKRLAYASLTIESNVWAFPLPTHPPISGAQGTRVTRGSQTVEHAGLSRDGKWLLYDSDLGGNMDLYRMSLATGIPEQLTTDPGDDFAPDQSPDGREIAFHSWRGGSRDIYVMPLDGGPVKQVTSSPRQEAIPRWSSDGSALTFIDFNGGGVWIARRLKGEWAAPVRRLERGFWPTWSPDGRRLAFIDYLLGGSLSVVPTDSGVPRLLFDASAPGSLLVDQIQWAPDGRTIYFKSHDRRGIVAIWSIPAAGGTPRLLVRLDDPSRSALRGKWAFGGNRFYFSIQERQSDVWVMEVVGQ